MINFEEFWEEEEEIKPMKGDFWLVTNMDDRVYFTKKVKKYTGKFYDYIYQVLEYDILDSDFTFSYRFFINSGSALPVSVKDEEDILNDKSGVFYASFNGLKNRNLSEICSWLGISVDDVHIKRWG